MNLLRQQFFGDPEPSIADAPAARELRLQPEPSLEDRRPTHRNSSVLGKRVEGEWELDSKPRSEHHVLPNAHPVPGVEQQKPGLCTDEMRDGYHNEPMAAPRR